MPAGTSWPRYLGAVAGCMLSMFAGAQTVHMVYAPLQGFDIRVAEEKAKLLAQGKDPGQEIGTTSEPSS